jgi:uncharacterized protein YjcR
MPPAATRQLHSLTPRGGLSAAQAYVKSKTDELLNLNNSISRLKKKLEHCERDAAVIQQEKDLALTATSQKTLEHGQVRLLRSLVAQRKF